MRNDQCMRLSKLIRNSIGTTMKPISKHLSLLTFSIIVMACSAAHGHEGHRNDDIVLKDLGYLGKVDFPVSCNSSAQNAMNTGVGLLHHMMYAQAELLFKDWLKKEPKCAMLYWGYAMSLFHPLWPDTTGDHDLADGMRLLAQTKKLSVTEREQSYINAAEKYFEDGPSATEQKRTEKWAAAQAETYKKYPNDIDAKAFYALSLLVGASKTDKQFTINKKAGELLATIIEKHPTHPGAIHYSIHAYDNPALAHIGVASARAYDKIAPNVPHALHMPTHIFVRLGEWNDAVSWNSRSAKAALKYPTKGSTSMHYVHALDYLVYAHLQLGEKAKAFSVLQQIDSHHPIQDTFPAAYALSTVPARVYLEQKEWLQASKLKVRHPRYISWDKFPQVEAITFYARGIGAARSGDLKAARENMAMLDQLFQKTQATSPNYWALLVDAQRKSVKSWMLFAEGQQQQALALLREAADMEDSLDKNPVTPGAVLPARDLLGDMLLLAGDATAAKQAYNESLAIGPKRRYSTLGIDKAQTSK